MNQTPSKNQDMPAMCAGPQQARWNREVAPRTHGHLLVPLTLALGLMVTLVWLVGGPVAPQAQAMPGDPSPAEQDQADAGVIRVATSGQDTTECGTEDAPCLTVQHAVDKALPGDEIRVAAGTYTDMDNIGELRQIVYLAKSLTIRGGYTTDNWTTPDPDANPTTLDAEGEGRVMVIQPNIAVNLEGLGFQGGNATGLGGGPTVGTSSNPTESDAGGGLYILTATVTISNCTIFSNTSSTDGPACGGGLYLRGGTFVLKHNAIVSNTAGVSVNGLSFGGGLYLDHGNAILSQNTVMSNTASYGDDGLGGGLYLYGHPKEGYLSASLLGNRLQGNCASRTSDGYGGGMYAYHYRVQLLDNVVEHNTAGTDQEGKGGGLYIFWSEALLERNLVQYNIASRGDEGTSGGVHLCTCTGAVLENNTIFRNTANTSGNGYGGGVSFCTTTATLDGNKIISNTATLSTELTVIGWGGGVWVGDKASVSLNNDLVAGNHAKTEGSGLWIGVEDDASNPLGSRLRHLTIADNSGGSGQGVYVVNAVVFLTNTIIAGHDIAVSVAVGGEATLEATLWYENNRDIFGGVEIGTLNYDGDPAFADPENWDYHIGPGSPALNQGVEVGVHTDMDGQRRPWLAPDLGADEYWPDDVFIRVYLPLILRE